MKKTVSQLWEDIFLNYSILKEIEKNGFFKITADQIRIYKEPRLMAKFDFYKQLPKVFKENNLGILPIRNGEYIIGNFNLFQNLSNTNYENIEITKVQLPSFIETINPDSIYSESNALNVALLSGMLENTFEEKFVETIQGKMRTNNFKFNISSNDDICNSVEVNGVAIEIDGGYESENKIVLIEAKNSMPNDFVIRQLYYPYRHWKDKVKKEIIPVFFAYDNGVYNLFVYDFKDINNYNSLELKTIKRYMVTSKTSEEIKQEIFENNNLIAELPQNIVPFPQADSFLKVLGTLELINSGVNTAFMIANEFEFEPRQGKYYIDALRYLNLVEKSNKHGEYILTTEGYNVINLEFKLKNSKIIKQILTHKPFYETYKYYLKNGYLPNKEYIKVLLRNTIPELSDETINRRSSTIKSWVQWIIGSQV